LVRATPSGERAVRHVSRDWDDSLTVVAGMTMNGMSPPVLFPGSMNAPRFVEYVERVFVLDLMPHDIARQSNQPVEVKDILGSIAARTWCGFKSEAGNALSAGSEHDVRCFKQCG
jgi:hypothetical protein